MAGSSLTPENLPAGPDRSIHKGHGIGALGPSDSSDSGSDVQGARGLAGDIDEFGLDAGNTSAPERSRGNRTAGPDLGDSNLDSDSDRSGTGETAAAGRDTLEEDGSDIAPDRVENFADIGDIEDIDEQSGSRKPKRPRG
jgi:hypothetical protein